MESPCLKFCHVVLLLAPLLTDSVFGRPTVSEGRPKSGLVNLIGKGSTDDVETIYERLKLGDAETWRQYGSEVVDVVYELVEEGAAEDPFDALLMLFYPNLTPKERKETLRTFEPLLLKLTEQSPVLDMEPEPEELTLYKRKRRAAGDDGEPLDDAGRMENDDDQLRNALRQLKIKPSESLVNLAMVQGKKRPPQRRAGPVGQKEMPSYLGTHESPAGISWRV